MFHSNLEQERILIKKLKQLGHVYGKPDLPILLHFWLIPVMAVFLPQQEQMTDLSVFGIKTNNVSCGPGICVKYFLSFPQKNLSPEKTETN